ncbi:MAG TPA: YwqG family protein [Longimicrobium sp.]|nr:YwqG family protein [Longimicrobium sp.]
MAESDEADALFRRYRREAVLLHRPWPPHAAPPANSHCGGLPRLPESHEWPRTSSGTPLHFLAQIDCADIRFKTPLPERGVLFFFGRDNTDAWMAASPATDHCRVLYAPDASPRIPPRQPPADLAPLGHPRTGLNVHPAWPVVPLRFDSFPSESALPDANDRDERAGRGLLQRLARGVRGAPEEPEIGADVRAPRPRPPRLQQGGGQARRRRPLTSARRADGAIGIAATAECEGI